MKLFHIHEMADSSVLALSDIRQKVKIDPDYQRPGGVWSLKKKQLFIDSLLNGYDIPKLYFHHLTGIHKNSVCDYSIIDGRQRLEAIWDFIDGSFALASDFKFFENEEYAAAGMTFPAIEKAFPRLLIRFHARSLTVMVVTADDLDFIEEMFSRLNEAVPLNAAEKRNALGGPLPNIIRDLAHADFFTKKVAFPSARYRHYDVAAKFLVQESSEGIVDTKKARLDDFVKRNDKKNPAEFALEVAKTKSVMEDMCKVFSDNDPLLKSSGMIVVYYVMFSRKNVVGFTRKHILEFEEDRKKNREVFEAESGEVNYKWIEYDELAQSSNDGSAIRERVEILEKYLQDKLAS